MPLSGYFGYCMYVAAPVTRDHTVTLSLGRVNTRLDEFSPQNKRTPHSEKQRTLRPSGDHSALTSPSAPDWMHTFQFSSRILYTLTTPRFAQAARIYSESQDQAAWVTNASEGGGDALDETGTERAGCLPNTAAVAEGEESTSQVLVI